MIEVKKLNNSRDWSNLRGLLTFRLRASRISRYGEVNPIAARDRYEGHGIEVFIIRLKEDAGEFLWKCPIDSVEAFITWLVRAGLKPGLDYVVICEPARNSTRAPFYAEVYADLQ